MTQIRKIKKELFITVAFIILSIILAMIFFTSERLNADIADKISDSLTQQLREEINKQKKQSVSLALALSQNGDLVRAVANNDRENALKLVESIVSSFESVDNSGKLDVQIHTKELLVFLRSWDKTAFGMPLESFRKGLSLVRSTQKPFVSIELGKKLNIKAIAPLIIDGKFVGSLEVIKNFDELVEQFKRHDISLIVLMEDRHLKIAQWMSEQPRIDTFVICQDNYNKQLAKTLSGSIKLDIGQRKSVVDDYLVAYEPIYDLKNERLGLFVLAIDKHKAASLKTGHEKLALYLSDENSQSLVADTKKIASESEDNYTKSNQKKVGEIR